MHEKSSKTEDSLDKIKISICMPTRNRANFIGEALESIISQSSDNVEIVIVDGASTDNTAEVVQKYQKKFRNLVYYCGKENGGVDRDMAKAIELSRGEYCWLFSDDDALKPGAMQRILKEIESGYEIYLCNVTACDLHMRPLRDRFWLSSKVKDQVFNLHNKGELIEYCDRANSIGALFSYWSSIVLRRQEWIQVGYQYDFDGSAYALAASLFSFINRKCRLKYIRSSLVLWRNDNESFQNAGGLVKRFLLDFDGYLQLADKYLPDDRRVRDSFSRVMKREHPWYTIIHVASFIDTPELWRQFRAKLFKFGYSHRMAAICYVLGRHRGLVSLAVAMKRKIVKNHYINKVARLLRRK
jgi:abequosyltransferase